MKAFLSFATLSSAVLLARAANNLTLIKSYQGSSFFDDWEFYGDSPVNRTGQPWDTTPWDDYTNGDVFYMGRANGSSLYGVDSTTGHAFINVSTAFVDFQEKRDSLRIMTNDFFELGTVWVFDVFHLPWGCGVWPSIWTTGTDWPNNGEIDIVEGQNRVTVNQMALHTATNSTCFAANNTGQLGTASLFNCATASGCTVIETKQGSYGQEFEANNGGMWAMQFDSTGIFIWFWPRGTAPAAVTTATDSIDISQFGTPSAAYPSANGCDVASHFGPQQLIIDITMCGDWAGLPNVFTDTCGNLPPLPSQTPPLPDTVLCYYDTVQFNGTTDLPMAYFEIGSIRAFSSNSANASTTLPPGATAVATSTQSSGSQSGTSTSSGGSATNTGSGNGAMSLLPDVITPLAAVLGLFSLLL